MLSSARPKMLDLKILGRVPTSIQLEVYSRQFEIFVGSMQALGFQLKEMEEVFDIIEGISWLREIEFEDPLNEKGGVAQVPMQITDLDLLQRASNLLKLIPLDLQTFLVSSKSEIKCGSKTETILKYRHLESARNTRDTLAKILYLCIFERVVKFINGALQAAHHGGHLSSIQILDIYGFESLETNSLEQLCINYTNEKLHHFTASQLVSSILEKFKTEGVCGNAGDGLRGIESACIKTISDLEQVMQRLDDQNKLNKIGSKVTDLSLLLTQKLNSASVKQQAFKTPHTLVVTHYTGITKYSTLNWLSKNHFADQSREIQQMLKKSESAFLKSSEQSQTLSAPKSTLTKEFRRQFNKLMNELQDSSFHFILCFRPNSKAKARLFEKEEMRPQLQGAGVQHLAKLNTGTSFPVHTDFNSLSHEFKEYFPQKFVANRSNREVAKLILSLFDLKEGHDYTVGITEIFLTQKQSALIEIAREDKDMFVSLLKNGFQNKFKILAWKKALIIARVCGVLFFGIRKNRWLKKYQVWGVLLRQRANLLCLRKAVKCHNSIEQLFSCILVLLLKRVLRRIWQKSNIIKKQNQILLKLMQRKEHRSLSMGLEGFTGNSDRFLKMAKKIFGCHFSEAYLSKLVKDKMMELDLQSYKFFMVGQHEFEWKRSEGKLYRDGKMLLDGITCISIHPDFPQIVALGFINHFQVLNFRVFKPITLEGQNSENLHLEGFIYSLRFKADRLQLQVLPPTQLAAHSELFAIYNWLNMTYEKPDI